MQPVFPHPIEHVGYAVLPVTIENMIANVINCYIAGNRRPTFRSSVSMKVMMPLLMRSTQTVDKWETGDKAGPIQLDTKKKVELMNEALVGLFSSLFEFPDYVTDLGAANAASLLNTASQKEGNISIGWSATKVHVPCLGYPRDYLHLDRTPLELPSGGSADQVKRWANGLMLPNTCSNWNLAIGATLLELDRGRFSADLIPEADAVDHGKMKPNEQPFGTWRVLNEQLRFTQSWFMLYAVQGSLIMAHAIKRWFNAQYDLAFAVDERAATALAALKVNYEYLLSLPLHPLLSAVASGLQTGSVNTYYGKKDLLYRTNTSWHPVLPGTGESTPGGDMRLSIVDEAVRDMILRDDAGGRSIWGSCNAGASADVRAPVSMGELARQIRSATKLTDGWATLASAKLGWTQVNLDVGELNQSAADYILTDGLEYSSSPAAGVLGLRPTLSLGNIKTNGFEVRHDQRFNSLTKTPRDDLSVDASAYTIPSYEGNNLIYHSAMVVDGFQGANGVAETMERSYIPAGMSMGEPDTTPMFAKLQTNSFIFYQLIAWFAKKAPAYVDEYYEDTVPVAADLQGVTRTTSWDTWSASPDASLVRSGYMAAFAGFLRPASDLRFITRPVFYHRFVVAMARGQALEFYDNYGGFEHYFIFGGAVNYGGDIELPASTSQLEEIVRTAPVKQGKLPLETDSVTFPGG
jgi:hypothetical protein